jgi:cytochrome oxidase Cu insertion factor (SCO1/SenC/PrrC family)
MDGDVNALLRGLALVVALAFCAGEARAGEPVPPPAPTAVSPAARREKARAYFTDTVLLDQDGRQVRFFSDVLDGNVVLLSFVFTRCVEACPLICQKLNGVRRSLGDEFGKVRFVSLSVDPDFDTPAELSYFARKQQAVQPNWTFLAGRKENVSLVLRKLGEWPDEPGNHTTAFMAGNVRTGHWTKIRPDMPAAAIADTLRRLVEEDRGHGDAAPTRTAH